VKAAAATLGYVETITGRRRYLPEMSSRNPQIRGEAERMAINHPIQGSEADMMKKAMIRIYEELESGRGPFRDVRLILQVHDELVFEVPTTAAPAIGRAVREIMEDAEKLSVPLVAEVSAGRSWGELRELRV
jgi:DNA polymerase-1